MGTLLRADDVEILLLPRTLIGRSPACDLVLGDASVSGEHAVIAWDGSDWVIRDLGSRNGTRVGEEPVQAGAAVALAEGTRIRFGRDAGDYVVVSVDAPVERPVIPRTVEASLALEALTLQFTVSHDEEHASWAVITGGRSTDLGDRVHTYLLLTLARARLRDADAPEATRGWCYADELARRLGITPEVLKVYVYRARQQLVSVGVIGAPALVERRAATNQIRLGTDRVQIDRA